MRDHEVDDDGPRGLALAGQLLLAFVVGGGILSWLFSNAGTRDFPDLRPYVATALGVTLALAIAVHLRAWKVAVGGAVIIPVLAAAIWYAYEIRWNGDLNALAAGGDAGSIAMVLRGRQEGWLWGIGAPTAAGSGAALMYALYLIWRARRAERD
jgi:hypothetical protein